MADDRAQKAQVELKHVTDLLHEESERVVKIESIKKALEIEVKNLTIRLEEVEMSALVNSKRIISKLEARVSCVVGKDWKRSWLLLSRPHRLFGYFF